MLNEADCLAEDDPKLTVFGEDSIKILGRVNTEDDVLLANVQYAIRQGHRQVRPQPTNYDRVVLVGGGPSLKDTEQELIELVKGGAKLVTTNGAYHWCLERNLFPKTQIVMDARASNARFVEPYAPECRYVLASQCAPETWNAVKDYEHVWIWHAAVEGEVKKILDEFYLGQWVGIAGGITVVTRAIGVLRTLGYLRFDLFGVDSCFLGGEHHAFHQVENEADKAFPFDVQPEGHPELARRFMCAPWHMKQFECFLQLLRINGDAFQLNVHGDGLLAYALQCGASIEVQQIQET